MGDVSRLLREEALYELPKKGRSYISIDGMAFATKIPF